MAAAVVCLNNHRGSVAIGFLLYHHGALALEFSSRKAAAVSFQPRWKSLVSRTLFE